MYRRMNSTRHLGILMISILSTVQICHAAEIALLSSQLDVLTQGLPTQIQPIDWRKYPCVTHDINMLAPVRTTAQNPYVVISDTIRLVQPCVTWQQLTCEEFLRPALISTEALYTLGYDDTQQIKFITILLDNANMTNKQIDTLRENIIPHVSCQICCGDASCGYHAIAHILTVNRSILDNNHSKLKELLDIPHINSEFGFTNVRKSIIAGANSAGPWRQQIQNTYHNTQLIKKYIPGYTVGGTAERNGEWLTSIGLTFLINYLKQTSNDFPTHISWKIYQDEPKAILEHLRKTFQNITVQEPYIENLIIIEDATKTQASHWFGIVITKVSGLITIIILDSKNTPRFHNETIIGILNAISNISAETIRSKTASDASEINRNKQELIVVQELSSPDTTLETTQATLRKNSLSSIGKNVWDRLWKREYIKDLIKASSAISNEQLEKTYGLTLTPEEIKEYFKKPLAHR